MSVLEKNIQFLIGLAEEVERSGTEFGKGRAVGIRETITDMREALASERAKFAAFADENGEPRKVLGTLPVLATGEFVTEGEVVHHPNQDLSIPGDLWIQKVDDSVLSHSRFPESLRECEYVAAHYYAEYDVGFFFAEFFDVSECYSTPEAATSALAAAKEQK